jgi:hypothetical protein
VAGGSEENQTVAETRPSSLADEGSLEASTHITVVRRNEEAERMVALLRLAAPVCALGLVAIAQSDPRTIGRDLCAAVIGVTLVVTIGMLVWLRDRSRFRPPLVLTYGLLAGACTLAGNVFFGVFSPSIMTGCVGIYFFGLSDSRRHAWVIYLACAIGHAALCVSALAGILPLDRSVLAIDRPDPFALATVTVFNQLLLALTFWLASQSRAATRKALDGAVRAAMRVRERDAVLAEVRADLDVARRGGAGRYTGRTLADYRIGAVLGRGAMGEVYEAYDLARSRPAAVKVLSSAAALHEAMLERFVREAQIASSVRSPHVVEVYGSGVTDGGERYLAMELLEGEDLAQHLRRAQRLPLEEAVELVTQIGEALVAGDAKGIVHRDVKPQNIFRLAATGPVRWKMLDFGVSKLRDAAATMTHGGMVGTPRYMPPEQARGLAVDHRSDVFALAAVAYRAITGRPPFTGADVTATIYEVLHVQPARPGELHTVPPDVEAVLALGLAKDRARRPATASALGSALDDASRGRLDPSLREAARRLLAEHPWGHDLLDARARRRSPVPPALA